MNKQTHSGSVNPQFVVISSTAPTGDEELGQLLRAVYVDGGFTDPWVADRLFAGEAVRARGTLITARDSADAVLLGMVILVPPGAAVRQIAQGSEAEMHLLAVHPSARRRGLGRALVGELLKLAVRTAYTGLVLSTQENMLAAHAIYERSGFSRTPARDWSRVGRQFLTYYRSLKSSEG